ncbi:MAG: hypothetical protein AVDCRST_MAG87-702 [uncultured Thermomicrobiales bacterium]|uniref:HTH tetR-type domain-containing protein n=1 Tax=uncultured Thermomicrobiales bacterium TaxID=1645740 RepID=A0A6J4UHF7_9BACT|nr:MAG: hypothetical protein AVDCRST_MAG87-702 [uncultured Thermomicrobiales bacterium]
MLKSPKLTGAEARRERGRQEMRTSILDAAGRLVATEGVEGLTIRGVAQAVGYSAGALYEYFDSKEAILASLYFDGNDGLGAHCERAVVELTPDADAVEAFHVLGHAYRSYALSHPELYRLVFGGFKTPPQSLEPGCDDEVHGGFGTLMQVANRGINDGLLIDAPAPLIAFSAWAAVHGFVSLEVTGHITGGMGPGEPAETPELGRQRRDQLFAGIMRMTLRGMLSEQGRARLDELDHAPAGLHRP